MYSIAKKEAPEQRSFLARDMLDRGSSKRIHFTQNRVNFQADTFFSSFLLPGRSPGTFGPGPDEVLSLGGLYEKTESNFRVCRVYMRDIDS
jgi:hypothetical protein